MAVNGISIFASGTKHTYDPNWDGGYYYPDKTWEGLPEKTKGAVEGVASSIDYNTAIRQATTMAKVLAQVILDRNTESKSYSYAETVGIGTEYDASESSLDSHALNLSKVLNKTNFLMAGEVTTQKINDLAVTREKINNYAVDHTKLGNILNASGTATISKTTNGLTVKLDQNSNQGPLVLSFTGDSVTKADTEKISTSNSKLFLTGTTGQSGYNALYTHSSVYSQAGNLYATNTIASGYMQAQYFNATSDIRLKEKISPFVNIEDLNNFIENAQIVTFKYKGSDETCLGVIAQQIKQNIGEFETIKENESGYLLVKESKLVYALWKYVQILNERIKQLEK